jgi:hypothetical protein
MRPRRTGTLLSNGVVDLVDAQLGRSAYERLVATPEE